MAQKVEPKWAANRQKATEEEEITARYVGIDETDFVGIAKMHVLKDRCSSEHNILLKTSTLRKGMFSSASSILNWNSQSSADKRKMNSDKLNNNCDKNETAETEDQNDKNNKNTDECKDLCDLIKAVNNATHNYKKNSNVYNVFAAKTVFTERRRSIPALPKLIGQKLNEHAFKPFSKGGDVLGEGFDGKELKAKTIRTFSKGLGRLLRRHSSVNISEPDPVFKVAYLGNVLTGWAKGEGCVDKPLATLWRNYNQSTKPDVVMKLSIANSGLKGVTKEHGLTEYWAHRITFCTTPPEFPKIFCWVYRHEGRKLKHELRCHAVLCSKESVSKRITVELQSKIKQALIEFKREKINKQNARLSLANSIYDNPSMPRRKILLSVGGNNYKPPLERSKSAPKLMAIEELCSEEDEEEMSLNGGKKVNTWTKDNSPLKMCCKADNIFPSYTLGRRKCERNKSPRKISLPNNNGSECDNNIHRRQSLDVESMTRSEEVLSNLKSKSCDTVILTEKVEQNKSNDSNSNISNEKRNHVTFSMSNDSELSEKHYYTTDSEDDNEVFHYEKDDSNSNKEEKPNQEKSDRICVANNFSVHDSDDGSISSGCETASTVTSSDVDMHSLPCNFVQEEYDLDANHKISVLERVQSFEKLFTKDRGIYIRNSINRSKPITSIDSDPAESLKSDSSDYISMGDACSISPTSDEVNLVPLGESGEDFKDPRRHYLRNAYPEDDDCKRSFQDHNGELKTVVESRSLDFEINFSSDGDKVSGGDSDSACSVESGYSELTDSNVHNDCVIGNTVMV